MLKLSQGANTDSHKPNGTQPNQNFEKNFPKYKDPNPFSEIPKFRTLRKFLHNLRQMLNMTFGTVV